MLTKTGKSVYGGIAIGTIRILAKQQLQIRREKIEDVEAEISRFNKARVQAKEELAKLYEKALVEVGEVNAMIFESHQIMLEDMDYLEAINNKIETECVNAEYAVSSAGDFFAEIFANLEDEYLKARAADVKDVSNRLIRVLQGINEVDPVQDGVDDAVIIMANDLAPSETVQLDKSRVVAFVTEKGSANSHTAILARTMNIPALIGIEFDETLDGRNAIIDGQMGTMIVDPDSEVLEHYEKLRAAELEHRKKLLRLRGKEDITLDGTSIQLYANIGNVSDLASVIENDAGGIGLFRSEFLYLENDHFPTEEEQFQAYKKVVEGMGGKKVIIRTLDIGADKQAEYFPLDQEENPAMGYRAIRICLDYPEMFKTQLRAIYRASVYGTVAVMYPMIISVSEVRRIKEIVEEVKKEMDQDKIPYGKVEQGVMIETPAAVMISDLLAKEVEFFSIGTNDLSQYTLAVDRQNEKLDAIYNPYHEALIRMISMTVSNGHKENCWVGICGELGADLQMTKTFLELGVDELSVAPGALLKVREQIRNIKL